MLEARVDVPRDVGKLGAVALGAVVLVVLGAVMVKVVLRSWGGKLAGSWSVAGVL